MSKQTISILNINASQSIFCILNFKYISVVFFYQLFFRRKSETTLSRQKTKWKKNNRKSKEIETFSDSYKFK